MKIPPLQHNKQRGTAFVRYEGRRVTIGKWNSAETAEKYRAFVSSFLQSQSRGGAIFSPQDPTVAEIASAFLLDKKNYYRKNGHSTRQIERFKAALEFPLLFFSALPAKEYGPKKLLITRDAMERSGRFSRGYINTLVNCIRSVWRYAVQLELIPAETLHALESVQPLKRGRSIARESERVTPVPEGVVCATLRECSSVIADMARIQMLTGMRPGDICAMRFQDLAETEGGIVYTLTDDKNSWRRKAGELRRVFLGPKAAAILGAYMLRECAGGDYVFQPADALAEQAALRSISAKAPRKIKKGPRGCNPCYTPSAYARAIARGAKRAGVPHWSPNQLRHLYASRVRARFGLDVAQTMLGHASADTTQIYAERDFETARAVAQKIG